MERSGRQGHRHSCATYLNNVPPFHPSTPPTQSPAPPSPSRSSNPIILNGRKRSVCPLTCQECFPPLSQRQRQRQQQHTLIKAEPLKQHCDLLRHPSIHMCGSVYLYIERVSFLAPLFLIYDCNHITQSRCQSTKYE